MTNKQNAANGIEEVTNLSKLELYVIRFCIRFVAISNDPRVPAITRAIEVKDEPVVIDLMSQIRKFIADDGQFKEGGLKLGSLSKALIFELLTPFKFTDEYLEAKQSVLKIVS